MSSSYRDELNRFLAELDVAADRVLDIGGAQMKMPQRVKSWNVREYLIADLPNPHEDSAKPDIELDLNAPIVVRNRYNTERVTDEFVDIVCRAGEFDIIFCLEVFEYVWNPAVAFEWIEQLMKSGGRAWVSFPSFYPLHQPVQDDALRYMPAAIHKLAESVGLEIVQIIYRRPESHLLETFFSTERMRAAKHEDHHFTGFIVEFRKSARTV